MTRLGLPQLEEFELSAAHPRLLEAFPRATDFVNRKWVSLNPELDPNGFIWPELRFHFAASIVNLSDHFKHSRLTVGELVPGLKSLGLARLSDPGSLPPSYPQFQTRLRNAIKIQADSNLKLQTWVELAAVRICEIPNWSNVGKLTARQLFEAALELGLRHHSDVGGDHAPAFTVPTIDPVFIAPTIGKNNFQSVTVDAERAGRLALEHRRRVWKRVDDLLSWSMAGHPEPQVEDITAALSSSIPLRDVGRLDLFGSRLLVWSQLEQILKWVLSLQPDASISDAISLCVAGQHPIDVANAMAVLAAVPVAEIVSRPQSTKVELEALFREFDGRSLLILEHRLFFDRSLRSTLEEIGVQFGLSRERVRQVEANGRSQLEAIRRTDLRETAWAVHRIEKLLGSAFPIGNADFVSLLNEYLPETHRELAKFLLLELCGSYKLVDDWAVKCDLGSLRQLLVESADEFGFLAEDAANTAAAFGIHDRFAQAALQKLCGLEMNHGHLMFRAQSIGERAIQALALLGRPTESDELHAFLGGQGSLGSMKNALSGNPRAVRTDRDTWGLAAWGLEAYSGISDEIAERILRNGGSVGLEALVNELTSSFSVSESSVRAYANAPRFVIENGLVRLRRPDEGYRSNTRISRVKGQFWIHGRLTFVLTVDQEILRGSGRPWSTASAEVLAVRPGDTRRFSGEGYQVSVIWAPNSAQPSLSSTRDMARSLNAESGQRVRVAFDTEADTAHAELVDESIIQDGPSIAAVYELTGLRAEGLDDLNRQLAIALECDPSGVRGALRERQETEVLGCIPVEAHGSELDEVFALANEFFGGQ